jgi:hypothetical protein
VNNDCQNLFTALWALDSLISVQANKDFILMYADSKQHFERANGIQHVNNKLCIKVLGCIGAICSL